ncbi:flagellar hook-associated protein 2 [Paenibacillus aurantius]|uniref:Flagellar hook-associated protein 2 n=1 Tax=Paenibacillus aurantius TaxID=2918900 RepID=A0AA96LCU1_9BACL|nr:flagellar hook-associated protein 2 [Paenibacillus aurantius]WNQ11604.1 flagellar hook-associated protein 2 [Paenibacillus aurantius]
MPIHLITYDTDINRKERNERGGIQLVGMRITGSSGMDIDSMVSQMMKVKRLPLDKLTQKKQTLEWQRDDYRSMNKSLLDFRNSLFNMKMQSSYMVKKASSSDTGVVTATGTANSGDGAYTIRVKSLAEAASLTSGDVVSTGAGDAEAKIISANKTLNVTGEKGSVSIELLPDDTISAIVKKVNAQSSATGVKMSYDANLDRFFFSSTTTGTNARIKLDMADPADDTLQTVFKLPSTAVDISGKNATVVFNGVQGEYASNTFSINGISFTANRVQSDTELDVRVTISQDADAVISNIKSFVEKYNELIETVNKKTSEERFRDFAPLTDDQRKEMKEDDVKRWEEKAKSGLLKNDSILTSGLSKFRLTLMGNVTGLPASDVASLTEIGITTGSYQENGKLYIDETKLRKALTDNPEQVMNLFTANDNNTTTTSADGIATRLYDEVTNLMSRVTEKAGSPASLYDKSFISKDIEGVKKDISKLTSRLADIENRYYRQFSAMETAMNKMSAQSSSLMQYFSPQG